MPGMSVHESLEDLEAWIEMSAATGTLRDPIEDVEGLISPPAVGPVTNLGPLTT